MNLAMWKTWSRTIMRTMRAEIPKKACLSADNLRYVFRETRHSAFIATCGERFVGFSIGFFRDFLIEDDDELSKIGDPNIFHLCISIVHPDFRGRGIGWNLLCKRISEAKRRGARNITCFARGGASLSNLQRAGGNIIGIRENFLDCGETFYIVHIAPTT